MTPQDLNLRGLWAAVFRLGVLDYRMAQANGRGPDVGPIRWFVDDHATHPGSFLWLCDLFDMHPDHARSRVLENTKRKT